MAAKKPANARVKRVKGGRSRARLPAKLPSSRAASAKLARLEARLREAEDTLDAIRGGHVDALVIQGPVDEQVFTLRGADHRYRQLVETMNEGALLVGRDGMIVYGNARFAQLVGAPLEHLLGSSLADHLGAPWHRTLDALLAGRGGEHTKAEVELVTAAGTRVPVYLSATASWEADQLTCLIATDLSAQKRDHELVAAEQLTSRIVEQAADGVVVCDLAGRVVRASNAAHRASGGNPMLQPFAAVFRIVDDDDGGDADGGDAARDILESTRRGETISGRELTLAPGGAGGADGAGGAAIDVLLSAAPILGREGEALGSVISFVDITERKRLAAERLALLETAQVARAEAEAASRAKDEFLAMLGHELRNPLAPILTALELMRAHATQADRTSETGREREIIERQVKHVVTLVDDLLDVSRITQGKLELDRRPIELAGVVARAVELASPLIEERAHQLELDVPAGLWLLADETRLCQVLSNLLVNVAKYTQRNGAISVRAVRDGDDLVIRVRDNGMGIPPDILPHLFERFVQGRRTIDRAEGGLGLGLAIVSSLVALHGGTVRVHSDGASRGSEFEIRLPALAERAETSWAEAALGAEPHVPVDAAAEPTPPRRVLVVDDNVDAADLLVEALVQLGHVARVAYDGPSALEVAGELRPEIAVLDIGLPMLDGFELARRMRKDHDPSGALRLIALTGYGQESDRRRSAEAGFDAHLIKPIDLGALVREIERLR